jgi:nucleotide-binding universal stress UspA family protein
MKYVLAVDGSDQSLDATRVFEALSPAENLVVLNAVNVPGIPYPAMGAGVAKDLSVTVERAMNEEGERIIDQAVSLLPLHIGATEKRLESGPPFEMILKVAEEKGTDLIVLGARGLGKIREQVFGSVSHRVMTQAPCSTLIVKKPIRKIQNILIPIASQDDADVLAGFFKKQPFREPASIIVLNVLPLSEPVWPMGALIPPDFRKEMVSYAEKFADVLSKELEKLGHQAKGLALVGAPAGTIVEHVQQTAPDLIIMRPHSRSGISRFFLGSVSHSVVHQTDCSILIVR